ncbi:coelenterazine h 2-monooxygenase-like [Dendronephthya gigantea]|uniref:coelenterazine h 2-monooxygenase-like n=1 Tax=Dendronephthya gigantea TaxID=151771 RepID=UPI00106CCA0B|nr:coelenterazine h 2-monooxygenase-like [Dendronephthya gigantea]
MSADEWLSKCKQIPVLDSTISYYDSAPDTAGKEVVVFLHGNPTYSYIWRNITPHIEEKYRCLAPDLIGMGASGKLPESSYKFQDHYKYIEVWIDAMKLPTKITIVCHDWGSGIAFHWCHMHPERVKSLVHGESVVMPATSWKQWPMMPKLIFQNLREKPGEKLVLKKNFFIERLIPANTLRKLHRVEMDAYRQPFLEKGESRRPMVTWPKEIPFESEGPYDVLKIVQDYGRFMKQSEGIPKLFIEADPGVFSKAIAETAMSWPNTRTVKVKGLHYLQEDSPYEIGKAITEFLEEVHHTNS